MSTRSSQLSLIVGGTVALCSIAACSIFLQKRQSVLTREGISKQSDESKLISSDTIISGKHKVTPISTPKSIAIKGLPKECTKKYDLSSIPGMIVGGVVTWISKNDNNFWYKISMEKDDEEQYMIYLEGEKTTGPMMNHEALCEALMNYVDVKLKPFTLSLSNVIVEINCEMEHNNERYIQVSFSIEGSRFIWNDSIGLTKLDDIGLNEEVLIAGGEKYKKTCETGEAVQLEFHNKSSEPFYIYWLSHDGRRHNCGMLKARTTLNKEASVMKHSTFVGHAWLLCNKEIDDNEFYENKDNLKDKTLPIWKGCMVTPVFGGKIFVDDAFIKKATMETEKMTHNLNPKKLKNMTSDSMEYTEQVEVEEIEDVAESDWFKSPNKVWGARVDYKGNLRVKYFNIENENVNDTLEMNELVEAIKAQPSTSSSVQFQDSFLEYEKIIGFAEFDISQVSEDGLNRTENVVALFHKKGLLWSPDSTTLVAIKVEPARDISILTLVESWPSKKTIPRYSSRPYLRPGDDVNKSNILMFKCPTQQEILDTMRQSSSNYLSSTVCSSVLSPTQMLSAPTSPTTISPTTSSQATQQCITYDSDNVPEMCCSVDSGETPSLLPRLSKEDLDIIPLEHQWEEDEEDVNINDQYNIELDSEEDWEERDQENSKYEDTGEEECFDDGQTGSIGTQMEEDEVLSIEWTCIEVQGLLFPDIFPNSAYWLHQDNFQGEELDLDWGAETFEEGSEIVTRWLFVHYLSRSRKVRRMVAVDIYDGTEHIVFEDSVTTSPVIGDDINNYPKRHFIDGTCDKFWRSWILSKSVIDKDKNEEGIIVNNSSLLYLSEVSGFNHIYIANWIPNQMNNNDSIDGSWVSKQLTSGTFVVFEIVRVIQNQNKNTPFSILFKAGGVIKGQDPYYRHFCRLDINNNINEATKEKVLTDMEGIGGMSDAFHDVILSKTGNVFVDIASRVDLAPVSCVRCAITGNILASLHQANMEPLLKQGWICPERFESLGEDGKTLVYGILIKPNLIHSIEPFPVLLNSYAGPHDAYCPKQFSLVNFLQGFARNGFVVAMCDGHGTNRRGVEFHQTCYQDIAGSGLPDTIKWLKSASKTRDWMRLDASKGVGIIGGSAGGQTSVRALIDHGDFFKVAVADCGCHDNRVDKLWWNEAFLGLPSTTGTNASDVDSDSGTDANNGDAYDACSNVLNAGKLPEHAKLMLVVGERDENVDPSCTMQLAGALQHHNKDFELIVAIGYGHGAADHCEFARRKRLQFLIQNLK